MERHLTGLPGFNPSGYARTDYQSGAAKQFMQRYRVRAPVFVRKPATGQAPSPPSDCHPWLTAAVKKSNYYAVNPSRPQVFGVDSGKIVELSNCYPSTFRKGDVILFTFTVYVVLAGKTWSPYHCPIDLVRVATGDPSNWGDPEDYALPVVDSSVRPSLAEGEEIEGLYSLHVVCDSLTRDPAIRVRH